MCMSLYDISNHDRGDIVLASYNVNIRFVARTRNFAHRHQFYVMCFTGCRSPRELSSRSLCWLLTVFGAWGRRISRASVFPCLTTLPGPVFVLLNVATCSFLERGRSLEQGVSVGLPLLCGTHCRLSFARHLSAVIPSSLD